MNRAVRLHLSHQPRVGRQTSGPALFLQQFVFVRTHADTGSMCLIAHFHSILAFCNVAKSALVRIITWRSKVWQCCQTLLRTAKIGPGNTAEPDFLTGGLSAILPRVHVKIVSDKIVKPGF